MLPKSPPAAAVLFISGQFGERPPLVARPRSYLLQLIGVRLQAVCNLTQLSRDPWGGMGESAQLDSILSEKRDMTQ
jgi:hypothetical protein